MQDFVVGLGSWVEGILDAIDKTERNELLQDVGLVLLKACARIERIIVERDADNSPFVDPLALPHVLPQKFVQASAADFIHKAWRFRLQHRYPTTEIDVIGDEHKTFLWSYSNEPSLQESIDGCTQKTSFDNAWTLLSA